MARDTEQKSLPVITLTVFTLLPSGVLTAPKKPARASASFLTSRITQSTWLVYFSISLISFPKARTVLIFPIRSSASWENNRHISGGASSHFKISRGTIKMQCSFLRHHPWKLLVVHTKSKQRTQDNVIFGNIYAYAHHTCKQIGR